MARTDDKNGNGTGLPEVIRRQAGTAVMRRHLSRVPAFALDPDLPDDLRQLLADLDSAERRQDIPKGIGRVFSRNS